MCGGGHTVGRGARWSTPRPGKGWPAGHYPSPGRGQSRAISPQPSERLVRLKESHSRLGTKRLIREAGRAGLLPPGEKPSAESIVYRLLAAAGLTQPPQAAPFEAGRRWAYRFAGERWSV